MHKRFLIGLMAVGFIAMGCSQASRSMVTLHLPSALATDFNLDQIVLDITGPDMPPIQQVIPMADIVDPVIFSIEVPVGVDRTFLVRGVRGLLPLYTGFVGMTTTDVTELGGEILITMEFVNFVQDGTLTDVVTPSPQNPDIREAEILVGTGDTLGLPICTQVDAIFFAIAIEPIQIAPTGFQAIIEFDTDNDPNTGSPATIISSQRGPLPTTFLTGSERTVTLIFDNQPALTEILLDDVSGSAPVNRLNSPNEDFDALVQLDPGGAPTEIFFCISRTKFLGQDVINPDANIDPVDMQGIFNFIMGAIEPTTVGFTANDIAFESGTIHYDLAFDTTGL